MIKLSEEQKDLLIRMGSPDDGGQAHVLTTEDLRVQSELMKLGLVHLTRDMAGKIVRDLTDEGEKVYGELTGEDVS